MELYIVFYQNNKADSLYSVCNSLEEAEKKFNDFISFEQKDRPNSDAAVTKVRITDNLYEVTEDEDYHAIVSYSRIPFNVFFSLEELIK